MSAARRDTLRSAPGIAPTGDGARRGTSDGAINGRCAMWPRADEEQAARHLRRDGSAPRTLGDALTASSSASRNAGHLR